jgi:cholesterol oxidase
MRALRAIWRFLQLRGDEFTGFGGNSNNSLINRIIGYWRVAKRHGEWRCLTYQFDADMHGRHIHVQGTKHLAYDGLRSRALSDDANPWISLVNIDLTFTDTGTGRAATTRLHVDLLRMSKFLDPLQSLNPAETPQALLGAASLLGLAARVMTQTHLWSFGAPNYRRFQGFDAWIKERMSVPSVITYGPPDQQRRFAVTIARPTADGWRLIKANARQIQSPRPPVLMIHGMAHGSRVFYTETVDHSMAGHLLDVGHDVWLLDHGLSICLGAPTATTIETIADQIAAAVKFVYDDYNLNRPGQPEGIMVFSHCVGSAAFSMAVLGGQTDARPDQSMIAGLVMHAIPPWIYPSEGNRLRSNIGMGLRRIISDDVLNPIPYDDRADFTGKRGPKQPAAQLLIDRFGSSLPWRASEYTRHAGRDDDDQFGRTICNRMTVLYGYEWQHANLDPRTHRALMTLVGPALGDAYAELRLMLHRGQITTKNGENEFVVAENFEAHWTFPTLFIHGDHNNVFDVESSRLSARKLTELNQAIAQKTGKAHTVDLRIMPGYGHMDLLFGMQAHQVVYPHISSFFAGHHDNHRDAEPKTRPEGEYQVITGPIISRPRRNDGGGLTIRVWVEVDEYQVETISTIQFLTGPDLSDPIPETDIKWVRQGLLAGSGGHSNTLLRSSFWIADIDCAHIRGGLRAIPLLIGMPSTINVPVQHQRVMEWTTLPWYRRLATSQNLDRISFIVGSCWYPGMWIDQDLSDRIFTKIRSHIESPTGIDLLLLVGDQIYADATRAIFDISEDRERFQESYRRAFNRTHAAWVLRHVPTYAAIDDHELRDNYPAPFPSDGPTTLSDLCASGVAEAWNFQIHHEQTPNISTHHLWYAFEQSGFDFFVFDTRTERNYAAKGLDRLISAEQVRAFEAWAISRPLGRPFFVVTGTPLTPIPRDQIAHPADAGLDDSLRAFPEFLELLAGIMRKAGRSQKFILLSGDPHFSSVTEFDVCEKPGLEPVPFIGIVSSGLNVPLPFANDYPDRTDWGKGNDIFRPVGHQLTITVKEATILSTSHAHAVRSDVSRNEQGRWTIALSVVDADDSSLPFAKVIDL